MTRVYIFLLVAAVGSGVMVPRGATGAQSGVTVSGTASDQTGAVIPGEKLTLLNKRTGETRKTQSDDSGHFSFSNVVPGEYVLTGEAEGFDSAEMALTVSTKPLIVTVKMEIIVSEDVTVSGRYSQPELPENNADAVNFNVNLISGLPTHGQNLLPLINNFLSPAALGAKGPSIIVDGVEDSNLSMPANAIRAVVINKNPYSAEYRRPGVARVEVITRQGSRKVYDGSVAFFAHNSNLSARNAFAVQKPDLDMRLLEAHFSGPLSFIRREKKNKRTSVTSAGFFLSGNRLINDGSAVVNAITLDGPLNQNVPTFKRNSNLLARFDFVPTKLTRVTMRYNFHDQPERNRGVGGLRLPEQGMSSSDRSHKFQFMESTAFSDDFLNTLRFVFERENQRLGDLADKPAIKVKGAFTGGPAQTARSDQETRLEFQDVAAYTRGRQTLRFGGAFRPKFLTSRDATNFGGTFIFSNLTDFAAGQPILFQLVQGNPEVSFSHHEAYVFIQDEIKLAQHLNLMLGLRYEWQAKLKDHNNFAPRVALAFAPGDQKTVFRLGAGIFYDRLPDTVVQRSLLLDGQHTRELVIDNPSFPDPFETSDPRLTLPSVWRIAPDISAPYLFQASFGLERRLGTDKRLTVEYQTLRGVHLFRARNINAPLGSSGPLPNADFVLINQVESSASLRSNAFVVALQGGLFENFKGTVQYTFSRTTDDTSGTFELPANNYDLRPELGRSNLDKRHRFNLAGTLSLPFDMKIGGILSLASGAPFDITTGFDDNADRVVNDRPLGVARNTGQGPGYAQLDLRLSKLIQLPTPFAKELSPGKKFKNLALNIDVFNVLNRNNLSDVIGERSSPLFGRANASLQARTFQLSFKYSF